MKKPDNDRRRVSAAVLAQFGNEEITVIQKPVVPVVETCEGGCVGQEQTPLGKITGKWPGKETIGEILDTLKGGDK